MEPSSPRVAFTVVIDDAAARARVIDGLCGPGAPRGVERCEVRGATLAIELCTDRSNRELVDAIIVIERRSRREEGPLARGAAVCVAAEGLGDSAIGESRLLESYLEGGQRC